ncbi:hypothetical protein BH09MYX1_BH09MYX1_03750 [soil metagenome]
MISLRAVVLSSAVVACSAHATLVEPRALASAPASASAVPASPQGIHPSSEESFVLFGLRALAAGDHPRMHDPELGHVEPALTASYAKMRADEDDLATLLRARKEGDTLVYEPRNAAASTTAIVFLHGYGGAFALPCWQIAHAVASLNVTTLCPSLDVAADWGSDHGDSLVRRTVASAKASGHDHIVLVGLSNGGMGASRLAPKMRGSFSGLVLISGADPTAASPAIPTLVFQGKADGIMSASSARTYAAVAHADYVEVAHGHFASLLAQTELGEALRAFVVTCCRN